MDTEGKNGNLSMKQPDEKLRKLQLAEFEILKKFKEICEKHHLKYMIMGGTLLGAVRHQGFIPWDDDIDVAMPRPDYEELIRIAPNEIEYPFFLHSRESDSEYLFMYARMENTSVKVQASYQANPQIWNAWIDIFPYECMPKMGVRFLTRKYHLLFRRYSYLLSCFDDMVNLRRDRPWYEMLIVKAAAMIHPNRFMNKNKQYKKLQNSLRAYPFEEGRFLVCVLGPFMFKYIQRKDFFERTSILFFEGEQFTAPENYEMWLHSVYGDYMILPSEEKRNKHHLIIAELHKGNIRNESQTL